MWTATGDWAPSGDSFLRSVPIYMTFCKFRQSFARSMSCAVYPKVTLLYSILVTYCITPSYRNRNQALHAEKSSSMSVDHSVWFVFNTKFPVIVDCVFTQRQWYQAPRVIFFKRFHLLFHGAQPFVRITTFHRVIKIYCLLFLMNSFSQTC